MSDRDPAVTCVLPAIVTVVAVPMSHKCASIHTCVAFMLPGSKGNDGDLSCTWVLRSRLVEGRSSETEGTKRK